MSCLRCASDKLKDFGAEIAIHFPGLEGLDKTVVLSFPRQWVCLECDLVEFVLPEEQKEQLRSSEFAAQPRGIALER